MAKQRIRSEFPFRGLGWAPNGMYCTAFKLREVEKFQGTRVMVVEGCGKDGHEIVREVIYWFDENDHLLARYDPVDDVGGDVAGGRNEYLAAEARRETPAVEPREDG